MLDLRQTPQYAKYMKSIGWIVERIDGVNYFIKKFPLIGSFIKIQRPEKINNRTIEQLSHKYRAFQIIIEPKSSYYVSRITYHGYKQNRNPYLPSKTIHIDLTKSEKKLLSEMHYKTRYNINKASQNPNLKIQISNDIEGFADFWQNCAVKQRKMFLSQKKEIIELYKAFGENAHILIATKNPKNSHSELVSESPKILNRVQDDKIIQEVLSGILLIYTKDISYYMYAAASDAGKKLFAPTLNTWEAIKLAKKLGCKFFDFEGIYDERFPLKNWKGFTRFKKSFGGKEIEYPGAYKKLLLPFRI